MAYDSESREPKRRKVTEIESESASVHIPLGKGYGNTWFPNTQVNGLDTLGETDMEERTTEMSQHNLKTQPIDRIPSIALSWSGACPMFTGDFITMSQQMKALSNDQSQRSEIDFANFTFEKRFHASNSQVLTDFTNKWNNATAIAPLSFIDNEDPVIKNSFSGISTFGKSDKGDTLNFDNPFHIDANDTNDISRIFEKENEPTVFPVDLMEKKDSLVTPTKPGENFSADNKVVARTHTHNLRPKRSTRAIKQNYKAPLDSDVDEDDPSEIEAIDKINGLEQVNVTKQEKIVETPKRKKRPYYRKNKHPKEVLERVEQERLKRKRIKNRELAARSRKKKKERMAFLEKENETLKLQVERLKDELKNCVCGHQ